MVVIESQKLYNNICSSPKGASMSGWKKRIQRGTRIPFVMVCWVAGVLLLFSEDDTTRTVSSLVILGVLWLWWSLGDGEYVKDLLSGCVEVVRESFASRMRTEAEYIATRQMVVDTLERLVQLPVSNEGCFTAFRSWELRPGSLLVVHNEGDMYVCSLFDEIQPRPGESTRAIRQAYRRVRLARTSTDVQIDIGERPVDSRNPQALRAPVELSPDDAKETLYGYHVGGDEGITIMDTLDSVLRSAELVGSSPAR